MSFLDFLSLFLKRAQKIIGYVAEQMKK